MTVPGPAYVDDDGWPVVDRLLAAAIRELVTVDGKRLYAGTVLDGQRTPAEATWPAVRVQRLPGGGIDRDGYQDTNRIEITSWGLTRAQSDEMTSRIRRLMTRLSNDEYAEVGLDRISEENGPGRILDPDQDLRAVPTIWTVITRQQ